MTLLTRIKIIEPKVASKILTERKVDSFEAAILKQQAYIY